MTKSFSQSLFTRTPLRAAGVGVKIYFQEGADTWDSSREGARDLLSLPSKRPWPIFKETTISELHILPVQIFLILDNIGFQKIRLDPKMYTSIVKIFILWILK